MSTLPEGICDCSLPASQTPAIPPAGQHGHSIIDAGLLQHHAGPGMLENHQLPPAARVVICTGQI